MDAFQLVERPLPQGGCEIQVEGDLDLSVADRLQEALDRAAADHDQILISLERCQFIDSTGIAVIIRAHTAMAKQGRRVVVYGPSSQVHRILSITGLTENGLVFESAEEALASPDGAAPTA